MKELSGKTFTQKMYAHIDENFGTSLSPAHPYLMGFDMSAHGYINLGEVEVTYTVPGCNPIEKAIESLDNQIQYARAEFQLKLNDLEDKKQQLLAIGYDGGDDANDAEQERE